MKYMEGRGMNPLEVFEIENFNAKQCINGKSMSLLELVGGQRSEHVVRCHIHHIEVDCLDCSQVHRLCKQCRHHHHRLQKWYFRLQLEYHLASRHLEEPENPETSLTKSKYKEYLVFTRSCLGFTFHLRPVFRQRIFEKETLQFGHWRAIKIQQMYKSPLIICSYLITILSPLCYAVQTELMTTNGCNKLPIPFSCCFGILCIPNLPFQDG